MLPIRSIIFNGSNTVIEKSTNIDYSQQIPLLIFIDFRYIYLILLLIIKYYRLSIFSIAHVHVGFHAFVQIFSYQIEFYFEYFMTPQQNALRMHCIFTSCQCSPGPPPTNSVSAREFEKLKLQTSNYTS